jgi:GTPase SAR1 family protein
MNKDFELSLEDIEFLVNDLIFKQPDTKLTPIQLGVLRGSFAGKTYDEIAKELNLSPQYINKDIGNSLWKDLSEALSEPVAKHNFKAPLKREWQRRSLVLSPAISSSLESPESSIDIDSPIYIERPPIETECYKAAAKPGALLRIHAPRYTGKTSLLNRIIADTSNQDNTGIRIDFRQTDRSIFSSLDTFLRWFCRNVTEQLEQDSQLDTYWQSDLGSSLSCTIYFQRYLLDPLKDADRYLVIGLDQIDAIFPHQEIAADFLYLLRSWHEEAKIKPIWKRLRLVIAYSLEPNFCLDIHRSPFNIGLSVKLPEFKPQQVQMLAQMYDLNCMDNQGIERLMALIGGHPYLIQTAFYNLASGSISLDRIFQEATTEVGIYSEHLRSQLTRLQQQPELAEDFKQVIRSDMPIQLEWKRISPLESMGLVKSEGNKVAPSCELYRQYFQTQLL